MRRDSKGNWGGGRVVKGKESNKKRKREENINTQKANFGVDREGKIR